MTCAATCIVSRTITGHSLRSAARWPARNPRAWTLRSCCALISATPRSAMNAPVSISTAGLAFHWPPRHGRRVPGVVQLDGRPGGAVAAVVVPSVAVTAEDADLAVADGAVGLVLVLVLAAALALTGEQGAGEPLVLLGTVHVGDVVGAGTVRRRIAVLAPSAGAVRAVRR